jgi:adenosylhomocysteine nucleosidase
MTADAANAPDTAHCDIGIVCALPLELAPFLDQCEKVKRYTGGAFTFRGGQFQGLRIAVVESGAGRVRARKAALALLDAHTPKWLLSAGLSGALRPELKLGDIVVADSIVGPAGEEVTLDLSMPADPQRGWHVGRIATADHIVRTAAEKQALAGTTGALAVDMESLTVAQVAQDSRTRFMAVRAISDDATTDLPPEVLAILGPTGSVRAGAVAGALWKRFSSAKDMWQMREQATRAAERLATFLTGVVEQLPIAETRTS